MYTFFVLGHSSPGLVTSASPGGGKKGLSVPNMIQSSPTRLIRDCKAGVW